MNPKRICFSAGVVLAAAASAASPITPSVTIEDLQTAWLRCDREASSGLVDPGTAAQCSVVHEQLLRRAFDGDFAKLLNWWKAQRVAQIPENSQKPVLNQ